jgi:hypothetical protein
VPQHIEPFIGKSHVFDFAPDDATALSSANKKTPTNVAASNSSNASAAT